MHCPRLSELPPPPPDRSGWPWTEETSPPQAREPNGSPWPRATIVTPAYNQAQYLEETIRSVLLQGYPDLEYIIIDDGSTDNTIEVIRKYEPWLAHWETQPNQGQCAAINNGFRSATGQIHAYLNSDDLLLPGAFQRAAEELDPARGRYIVMGRCRFTDEQGRFTGIEHPSHFESHRRILEVWKGHTIPQPAVFWTSEVWQDCGPMIEDLGPAWIDYGLFCRFSRKYKFHFIDQVFATYRLHTESKTQSSSEAKRLAESIQISRRYWGKPWSLMYWQLAGSLALYRFNRLGRGVSWLRRAKEARRQGHTVQMLSYGVVGAALAPEAAFYAAIYPSLRNHARGALRLVLDRLADKRGIAPQTAVFFDRTDPWEDGWAGPRLLMTSQAGPTTRSVLVEGTVELKFLREPVTLTVQVDGRTIGKHQIKQTGPFGVEMSLPTALAEGAHSIEVQASVYFVPQRFLGIPDYRPLSWKVGSIEFRG